MKEKKANKIYTLQVRCTEDEKKLLDKYIRESGMKRSDYMRAALLSNGRRANGNAQFTVKAQELLNYLEGNENPKRKKTERMVDELWKLL